jgi:hypothetical protein
VYIEDTLVVAVKQDPPGPSAIALGPAPGSSSADSRLAFDDVLVTTY